MSNAARRPATIADTQSPPAQEPVPHSLNAIDHQIVALHVRDGRAGAAQISRALEGVSERSVRYRIERLLRDGVIQVGAVVDPHALGFDVIADVFTSSYADSEGNGRTANTRRCQFAGEKLEAAIGVEPMMEVLQSSVGPAQG